MSTWEALAIGAIWGFGLGAMLTLWRWRAVEDENAPRANSSTNRLLPARFSEGEVSRAWDNPVWVGRTPIATSLLLDGGAIGQIVRMWRERSALGQSLTSWLAVILALVLWANFYRVITPTQFWARLTIVLSIALNAGIVVSIVWWRYVT